MPKKKIKTKKVKQTKTVKKSAKKSKAIVRTRSKKTKVAKAKKAVNVKKTGKSASKIISVGGLSFSHGVMIRTHDNMAIALQDDAGDVEVISVKLKNFRRKYSFLFWPFIRGIFYLIENVYFSLGLLWHKSYFVKRKLKEMPRGQRALIKVERFLRYAVYFLLIVGLFDFIGNRIAIYPTIENSGMGFLYTFLINTLYIFLFIALLILVSFSKKSGAQSLSYHSAEHQIINAYEKFGYRDDLLKKAESESKINRRCGVAVFFWSVVVLSLLINVFKVIDGGGVIVFAVSLGLILLSFSLSYEIIKISNLSKNNLLSYIFVKPLYLIQYIFFRKPTKKHLVAGLYALEEAIGMGK
jgi:uncharacterized protein YqhQ